MSEQKRRILFAYAPVDETARSAAESVAAAMRREFADVDTRVVDIFDYVNPAARTLLTKGYASMRSMAPGLWGFLYEKESLTDSLAPAENFARSIRWDDLRGLLAEFPPDVVVSTQPFATAPFSRLKGQGVLEVPLVAILTDYQVHNIDVQPGVSLYTCADPKLTEELQRRGVERELVYPCGIPLPAAGEEGPAPAELKQRFGLSTDPGQKVILVLAQSWESDIADRLLFQLSLLRTPRQILISAGANQDLADRLRRFASIYGVRAKLFGEVDDLRDFMAVSDLVVTKGGGQIAAQLVSLGVPMLILDPDPGQEQRTSRFLADRGAARHVEGVLALGAEIDFVLGDSNLYARMKQAVAELAHPNAARDAARAIYLAAQNRAEIVKREREHRAGRPGETAGPGGAAAKPTLEDIGQEQPADLPPQLSRAAAKELLTGWIMNEKDAQRRYEEAYTEAERWQRRAELAARRSQDHLAKEALARAEQGRRDMLGIENELRRIAAEKAKITGRTAGPPVTSDALGRPDTEQAALESQFRSMELDDELQRLKRRLESDES